MLWERSTSPAPSDPTPGPLAPSLDRGIGPPPACMRQIYWLLGIHDEPTRGEPHVRAGDAVGALGLRWMLARLDVLHGASERECDRAIDHLLPEFDHGRAATPADSRSWPEELRNPHGALAPEGRRLWRSMLQELPARHRAALVLHDVLGLDHRAVASHLETTVAAVRRLLHQARLAMCTLAARGGRRPEQFWG